MWDFIWPRSIADLLPQVNGKSLKSISAKSSKLSVSPAVGRPQSTTLGVKEKKVVASEPLLQRPEAAAKRAN